MITVAYFWPIKPQAIPVAILNMATNKLLLRRVPGIKFIKLLGTGKGESFTPKDADQLRWGILVTINESNLHDLENFFVVKIWRKISSNQYRVILKPIASHGLWSKQDPFIVEKFDWSGKVAAVTRARKIGRAHV